MLQRLDISLVKGLPPFRGLEDDELRDLIGFAQSQRFEKGSTIFSQDEEAEHFYLLLDGHIRVAKLTPDGEQMVPRYISSGELFGFAIAMTMPAYPANAIVAVDCVVLVWPNSVWERVAADYPTFAKNTYHTIGERLAETQEQLVELATERVEQRVAHAILKLAKQTGRKTEDGILIDFPISRQDISEMTGTTLHTVSRLLSAWENYGWVKSGRQKITLVEGHKLVVIAHGGETPATDP